MIQPAEILIEPIVTEKATAASSDLNQYTFKVAKSANQLTIKQAIEQHFDVEVRSIQVINVKPKFKMNRMRRGVIQKRLAHKKAIVRLKEGQTIELV